MDSLTFFKGISKPISKKKVVDLAAKSSNSISGLIKVGLHRHYEVAFRPAWITEMVHENY